MFIIQSIAHLDRKHMMPLVPAPIAWLVQLAHSRTTTTATMTSASHVPATIEQRVQDLPVSSTVPFVSRISLVKDLFSFGRLTRF